MRNSDEWDPPPLLERVRNPAVGAEWLARCRQWELDNAEVSRAWEEALEQERERHAEARRRETDALALKAAGVSERAVAAWRDGLRETPATRAVETFLGSKRTFLLLMGAAGSGKTQATTLALARRQGLFVRALELARLSLFDAQDRKRLEQAQRARLLVLDDLGAEMLHDAWRPALDELVDIRWGERRKTIITTNLDAAAFKARYGVRIADRLRDDGFIEKVGDKSLRGQT